MIPSIRDRLLAYLENSRDKYPYLASRVKPFQEMINYVYYLEARAERAEAALGALNNAIPSEPTRSGMVRGRYILDEYYKVKP